MAMRDPKDAEREVLLSRKAKPVAKKEPPAEDVAALRRLLNKNPLPPRRAQRPAHTARERDEQTERVYEGIRDAQVADYTRKEEEHHRRLDEERKTRERTPSERPPGGPAPMIRHGVGPVHQLSSQTAHTYGYTPEAYDELSRIPTRLDAGDPRLQENGAAGLYYHNSWMTPEGMIVLGMNAPSLMAHEQAHGWWDRKGMEFGEVDPEIRGDNFARDVRNWASYDPAVRQALWQAEIHPHQRDPSELHSYLTENMFPDMPHRQNMPEEIRPYFRGYLAGMEEPGPPLPPPRYMKSTWAREREWLPPEQMGPDDRGYWG